MCNFDTVTFDSIHNNIKLGPISQSGLTVKNAPVKLNAKTSIPARSEKSLWVSSSRARALVEGDFEPNIVPLVRGLYVNRTRVLPNIDGFFPISVLNVTTTDISHKAHSKLGALQPISSTLEINSLNMDEKLDFENLTFGDELSNGKICELKHLISESQDIFALNPKKPKRTKLFEHRIVMEDALPVYQKPRPIPAAWEHDVATQVTEMLTNDIIRPSVSPWNAPVILVQKKDLSTLFVCDFRGVNDVTKRDTYPLPHIKDVIDKMSGSQYWTTLDAASAYWSVPLPEADKEKTAFLAPHGKFEFNVMPYGLTNAGATYQRMVDMCLSGLSTDRVLAYMDDIVIFNSTFEEHMKDLTAVFSCLRNANVSLKPSKCVFAANKVDFLGFELSPDGIKPQVHLTAAINQLPTLKSKNEIKRFLGMAGLYCNIIRDFATISQPLNKLTCDNVQYLWTNDCESAFQILKQQLLSRPVLAFPKLGTPFVVEVDASEYAAGGVLSQLSEANILHPVSYYSTAFKGSQCNCAAISKEAFALVLAIRHWHVYLAGTTFVLNSDHNSLFHLRKERDPTGKFASWIAELEEYNYTVRYIKGSDNVKADLLSRTEPAVSPQPVDLFDDKIYATTIDHETFRAQLQTEQAEDPIVSRVIQFIRQNQCIR